MDYGNGQNLTGLAYSSQNQLGLAYPNQERSTRISIGGIHEPFSPYLYPIPYSGQPDPYSNQPPLYPKQSPYKRISKRSNLIFNAVSDAKSLKNAMRISRTNKKMVIDILAKRTNEQRQIIAQEYQTISGKPLLADLESRFSGKINKLIVAMMKPIDQFYAEEINRAISGIGTDVDSLIQCLCSLKNNEIQKIRKTYRIKYHQSLEKDINDDTSGDFQKLLLALIAGKRDESTDVDDRATKHDAMKLYAAGAGQLLGTDEMTFISIICQRNVYQLRKIFQEYHSMHGHSIYDAINEEFSGDIANALVSIVKYITNSAKYFAEELYNNIHVSNENDRGLIRLVVTHSQVDMADIKREFVKILGTTLENQISKETSGDFQKCLNALISA